MHRVYYFGPLVMCECSWDQRFGSPEAAKAGGRRHETGRLPSEPVIGVLGDVPDGIAGERMGVSRTTWLKWRRSGIPERHADRVAIALGFHPVELWPEYHDDVPLPT